MEKTIATLEEGAYISAGAIAGAWFLDPDEFFASNIKANPAFTSSTLYEHWGAVIAIGAAWGSTKIDYPIFKAAAIGIMIYGILIEARADFGWDNTFTPPNPRWGMMGNKKMDTSSIDAKLKALAEQARTNGMKMGVGDMKMGVGRRQITQGYTGIGNKITRAYTGVGGRRVR